MPSDKEGPQDEGGNQEPMVAPENLHLYRGCIYIYICTHIHIPLHPFKAHVCSL